MAEIILTTIAKGVTEKLTSLAAQEISLAWGVKTELEKLNNTMLAINAVLLDAEQQQSKSHAVKLWLKKLKDVVYDIYDVLDDFMTEALRKNVETQQGMLKEVRNFFSKSNPFIYRLKMGHKMKNIRERLDEIASNRNFQLSEHVVETRVQTREGTHSFVLESEIIGRDNDKKNLVQLIMTNNDQSDLLVIPIVGLGGLGKTTLAKLAYNDTKISRSYELRMWVCVSEDSNLNKVIERIIKSATGVTCEGLDLDQLQSKLRRILNSTKFLLVLDDLWEDDPRWWTELRSLLVGGAIRSTVIVTTRNSNIGSIVRTTTTSYILSELLFNDCLSLFLKCAFKEGKEKEHPELMKIGKEIVKKCGGVPLAVKFLGSLLYMKTDVGEWSYIMNNDILALEQKENDILPALRLSYEQLPTYLKPCFVYCCIFPKSCEIQGYVLINLWIAQGLLQSRDRNERLEDIGNRYLNELLSRSFFQNAKRAFDNAIQSVKMHDLVHDLSRSVAGTESLEANIDSSATSENVRHLLFCGRDLLHVEFPKSLVYAKKVRSFKFSFKVDPINQTFVETLIMSFMRIRFLDLSGSTFEVLPRFICKLKHLRYLNLERNRRLKALPNSICKLLNLQFLSLYECDQLQDLPRDFGNLISLRFLIVTSQMVCMPKKGLISLHQLVFFQCDQLESLPEEIQHLTALRELLVANCDRLESLPGEIQHLTALRELQIVNCPRLAFLPTGMKCLTALEKLVIGNCPELHLFEEGEDLSGLRSLWSLNIRAVPKLAALPHGLVQSASTLQYLCIDNCPGLTALPEWFQNLTSLQRLYMLNCPNLLSLPEGMQCLTSLQQLVIRGSPHLIERCEKGKGEDWPKISQIPEIYY